MKLVDKDITKFQGLYSKYFGISLTKDQARLKLTSLVMQMKNIYRPVTEEQFKKWLERDIQRSNKDL